MLIYSASHGAWPRFSAFSAIYCLLYCWSRTRKRGFEAFSRFLCELDGIRPLESAKQGESPGFVASARTISLKNYRKSAFLPDSEKANVSVSSGNSKSFSIFPAFSWSNAEFSRFFCGFRLFLKEFVRVSPDYTCYSLTFVAKSTKIRGFPSEALRNESYSQGVRLCEFRREAQFPRFCRNLAKLCCVCFEKS